MPLRNDASELTKSSIASSVKRMRPMIFLTLMRPFEEFWLPATGYAESSFAKNGETLRP
jgi:hypothetical protein